MLYHAGNVTLDAAQRDFLEARENARRFHADAIGRGVDPSHCLGDFLARVKNRDTDGIIKHYWAAVEKSGNLSEVSGKQGGYLVPPDLNANIFRELSTGSLFRRHGAYVHPMRSETCSIPTIDMLRTHAAGIAPYFGGFQPIWWNSEDASKLTKMATYFRELELRANPLGGYLYASNPFLQDALGADAWLYFIMSRGLAYYQDAAFFAGNGVGMPNGVTGSGTTGPQVTVTRTTANKIVAADIQAMQTALLPASYEHAVWFAHPSALAQITALTGWIPNGLLMINGRPLVPADKCATLGKRGDLMLIDPTCYVIGDRLQVEIDYSPHEPTAFLMNKSAFKAWSRVDGQPLINAPIVEQDGTTQTSPFVVLNSNPAT